MRIWITSDHHFGHINIIRFQNRPFDDVNKMDSELIARWNEVVNHDDVVYHLGDFTLGGRSLAVSYIRRLKGTIRFVASDWHHDKRWIKTRPRVQTASGIDVEYLEPVAVLKAETPIIMSHWPFAEWDGKHRGTIHAHGHSHCNHHGTGKIMDVGVDCNDFVPVSLEYILDRFSESGKGMGDDRAT